MEVCEEELKHAIDSEQVEQLEAAISKADDVQVYNLKKSRNNHFSEISRTPVWMALMFTL